MSAAWVGRCGFGARHGEQRGNRQQRRLPAQPPPPPPQLPVQAQPNEHTYANVDNHHVQPASTERQSRPRVRQQQQGGARRRAETALVVHRRTNCIVISKNVPQCRHEIEKRVIIYLFFTSYQVLIMYFS